MNEAILEMGRDHLFLPLGLSLPQPAFAVTATQTWLNAMGFYSVDAAALRTPQSAGDDLTLMPRGENLSKVWARLVRERPARAARIVALLSQVVPGLRDIQSQALGRFHILSAALETADGRAVHIDSHGLSDGTLHALALLVAVYTNNPRQFLIALEEPEAALHPHAAGLLFEALLSAPERPQLVISTHSPFILESAELDVSMIRVVQWHDGETIAGRVAADQRQDIADHLTTGAELLVEGSLAPEVGSLGTQRLRPAS